MQSCTFVRLARDMHVASLRVADRSLTIARYPTLAASENWSGLANVEKAIDAPSMSLSREKMHHVRSSANAVKNEGLFRQKKCASIRTKRHMHIHTIAVIKPTPQFHCSLSFYSRSGFEGRVLECLKATVVIVVSLNRETRVKVATQRTF